jgi:HK97 family phage portal protein
MDIGIQTKKGFYGLSFGNGRPIQIPVEIDSIETAQADTGAPMINTWESMLGITPGDQTRYSASRAMSTSAWAFRSVSEIITAVQSVPLRVETQDKKGQWVFVDDAPAVELFQSINEADTDKDFIAWLVGSLELYGGTWFEIEANTKGTPIFLWPMHSQITEVVPDPKRRIKGYIYRPNGKEIHLKAEDVFYMKYWNPANLYYGLAPYRAAQRPVEIDWYAQDINRRTFKKGGIVSGMLVTEQGLTQPKATELKKRFKQALESDEMPVMSEGLTYKPLTPTLKDMLFRELREFNREEIGAAFGVPPAMLGINKYANYANYDAQKRKFWESNIQPKLQWIEASLNASLMPKFGITSGKRGRVSATYRAKFDISRVKYLQEDPKERVERQAIEISSGTKTVNETRVDNGDAPYDDPIYDGPTPGAATITDSEGNASASFDFRSPGSLPFPAQECAALSEDPTRFVPVNEMGPIRTPVLALYNDLMKEMTAFLGEQGRMARLRTFAEALNPDNPGGRNRDLLADAVRAVYNPFDWHREQGARIAEDMPPGYEAVYSRGARLGQRKINESMGVARASLETARFSLVNKHILFALESRASFWIDRGLSEAYEQAQSAMVTDYFDKYKDFKDEELLASIQRSFNHTAGWEALRTARTETHIVGQQALQAMFDKSGVEGRGWLHSGIETGRANHIALHKKEVNLAGGERFQVGAYAAVGPGDPTMGVEELANCGCDSYPVIVDADKINIWDGA